MPTMSQVASLAKQGRFLAAADCALDVAKSIQSRQGQNRELYESLGAAAKFFHLGGEVARSVTAFDRCFEVFDNVVAKQDSPILVVQHLRTWPELFARAAFAALDAGQPKDAVRYAEFGRARLVGALFRGDVQGAHDGVVQYRSELHRVTLRLASRAFANGSASSDERLAAESLRLRRRHLLESGVPETQLTLTAPGCLPDDLPGWLEQAPQRTAVLYAIALDDAIRLILIAERGYRELPLDDSQGVNLALGALSSETRRAVSGEATQTSNKLEAAFQSASAAIGPRWQRALDGLLGDVGLERLLWIPHGSMVQFPLGAVCTSGGPLGDRVSIQIAPSLGVGISLLSEHSVSLPKISAIEGPDEDGVTRGGEILVRALGAGAIESQQTHGLDELKKQVERANFVLVSCHGVFDWSHPFQTRLRLGLDLSLVDIASSQLFDDGTLVLLNSCDAGTVAQSEINEAVGLPPALMAAGAHCVIGASQPVSALAAAVFSHLLMAALGEGLPSPEAARKAAHRLRRMRRREVRELLSDLKYPLLLERGATSGGHLPAFERLVDFALFQHWGPAWRWIKP